MPPSKTGSGVLSLLLVLVLLSRCAVLVPVPSQKPPSPRLLDKQAAEKILEHMKTQNGKVRSFFSIGSIAARQWYGESEADILIVGSRDPFKIKMEITHSWGKPLLYLLIEGKSLMALDFAEERRYVGAFSPETLSRFIPGGLDADIIWGALRGYPSILPYDRFDPFESNQILLFNKEEARIEEIELTRDGRLPSQVFFPGSRIRVAYSDFQTEDGIDFARLVTVKQAGIGHTLILRKKKSVFNKPIPDGIFSIQTPPSFSTVYLDER